MDLKKIIKSFIEYMHSIPVDAPLNDEALLKKNNKKKHPIKKSPTKKLK